MNFAVGIPRGFLPSVILSIIAEGGGGSGAVKLSVIFNSYLFKILYD